MDILTFLPKKGYLVSVVDRKSFRRGEKCILTNKVCDDKKVLFGELKKHFQAAPHKDTDKKCAACSNQLVQYTWEGDLPYVCEKCCQVYYADADKFIVEYSEGNITISSAKTLSSDGWVDGEFHTNFINISVVKLG
jgi:hypothetical protein